MLDWRRDGRGPGDQEVAALLATVQGELGGERLRGTRFVFDTREMLAATREIEVSVRGHATTLLVGFQRGSNLEPERRRYERLAAGGVTVVAFGVGSPQPPVAGVRWVGLALDEAALANQWFLVTRAPEPFAFVGFETSPPERFGLGGIHDPDRTWAGFVSDDGRLVNLLIEQLDRVGELRRAGELPSVYLVATHDGSVEPYERTRRAALDMARDDGARVILYDRSTESYLVDPYPAGTWVSADVKGPSGAALLGPAELVALGRGYLAEQVEAARRSGVEASALLARGTGIAAMADTSSRFGVSRVFLPAELARPGLLDRVRGNTLATVRAKLRPYEIFLVDEDAVARADRAARLIDYRRSCSEEH